MWIVPNSIHEIWRPNFLLLVFCSVLCIQWLPTTIEELLCIVFVINMMELHLCCCMLPTKFLAQLLFLDFRVGQLCQSFSN